jgi:sialate O-acetylesterase
MRTKIARLIALSLLDVPALRAELKLPAIIGDHMVLQQKLSNPIWGWDTPGTKVTVTFAGQSRSATAGADGRWALKLAPMPANASPQTLTLTGTTRRQIADVLIGEVWLCSGQSNMQLPLWNPGGFGGDYNGDVEALDANLTNLRLITVPNVGT